ncbi:hypothetical protein CF68_19565 [Cupriavidus sp. SK-4]|nr:hypothetical protein CF68_19565 [Cupriavidus sp. SK-4]
MALFDVHIDLLQDEARKADIDALRSRIQLAYIHIGQGPDSAGVFFLRDEFFDRRAPDVYRLAKLDQCSNMASDGFSCVANSVVDGFTPGMAARHVRYRYAVNGSIFLMDSDRELH